MIVIKKELNQNKRGFLQIWKIFSNMPKPTKLHPKGKMLSNSKQKPVSNGSEENSELMGNEEAVRQFQLELCWCIQELERTLSNSKVTEKQVQEAWKVLQVLKNNNQPIIRKRQLMRLHFGDYRAKMLAEEKKLAKMTSKMKIVDKPENPKATFLRKSLIQSTGDNSFRFNFNLPPHQINCTTTKNTTNTSNNTHDNSNNTFENLNNTHEQANNTLNPTTTGSLVTDSGDSCQKDPLTQDNSKSFKFALSGSEFRFNFNVNSS